MDNLKIISQALIDKKKMVAMIAPSFIAEFSYPEIIFNLKELGFDKIVELTFGAKIINKEYHNLLEKDPTKFYISTVCPGVVETIRTKHPELVKNLINIDSPMVATAKICRKYYPKHKTVFISPCHFKKIEAGKSNYVDYVLDYQELKRLLEERHIDLNKGKNCRHHFDKFYNDYTKIYPLAGGLSRTAHLNGVLKKGEEKVIDGITNVEKFIQSKKNLKGIRFLDANFCVGGCIGGPCISKQLSLKQRKKRLLNYLRVVKCERIPDIDKGLLKKAKGIKLKRKYN